MLLKVREQWGYKRKKGINLPDTNIKMNSMTKKDFSDLKFVLSENIEWIALSFVRKRRRNFLTKENKKIRKHSKSHC